MAIEIKDWTKQIEDLDVLGIDQLHETYSEMLATAHDIGYTVPDEYLVETDDDTVLRGVIGKLHPEIVKFASENSRAVKEPKPSKPARGKKSAAAKPQATAPTEADGEESARTSPKKPAKAAAQKGKEKESTEMATTAKKTAKAPAKKAAKAAKGAANKAASNARTPVKAGKLKTDGVITVKLKENPAKKGSGRFERVANMIKHNGKTVEQFLKSGGKRGTLNYSVEQGWITIK